MQGVDLFTSRSVSCNSPPTSPVKSPGKNIPKAIREQTWLRYNGMNYIAKCHVLWCTNKVTPFTFEVGHNTPYSKGGMTEIDNLRPICSACNKSMGNKYTIDEFSKLSRYRGNKGSISSYRRAKRRCMEWLCPRSDDCEE